MCSQCAAKAVRLFSEKCEYAIASGAEVRQTSAPANPSQQRNLSICSALEEISGCLRLNAAVVPKEFRTAFLSAADSADALAGESVDQIFKAVAERGESILLGMHDDPLWGSEQPANAAAGVAGCSPSMEELLKCVS